MRNNNTCLYRRVLSVYNVKHQCRPREVTLYNAMNEVFVYILYISLSHALRDYCIPIITTATITTATIAITTTTITITTTYDYSLFLLYHIYIVANDGCTFS